MLRLIIASLLVIGTASAQTAPTSSPTGSKVTTLMTKDLQGIAGKEGVMLVVEYPPGMSGPVHRHNASVFVYVLEGSVVMQNRGGKEVTLTPGQTFFESPSDIHIVGRNASQSQPAKFLVFFVKDKGAPTTTLVK